MVFSLNKHQLLRFRESGNQRFEVRRRTVLIMGALDEYSRKGAILQIRAVLVDGWETDGDGAARLLASATELEHDARPKRKPC